MDIQKTDFIETEVPIAWQERQKEIISDFANVDQVVTFGQVLIEIKRIKDFLETQNLGHLREDLVKEENKSLRILVDTLVAENPTLKDMLEGVLREASLTAKNKLLTILALEEYVRTGEVSVVGGERNTAYYFGALMKLVKEKKGQTLKTSVAVKNITALPDSDAPLTTAVRKRLMQDGRDTGVESIAVVGGGSDDVNITALPDTEAGGNPSQTALFKRIDSLMRDALDPKKTPGTMQQIAEQLTENSIFLVSLIPMSIIKNFDHFFELIQLVKSMGAKVAFDTNYRDILLGTDCFREENKEPLSNYFKKILPYIDILFAGDEDLYKIYGSNEDSYFSQLFCKESVLKKNREEMISALKEESQKLFNDFRKNGNKGIIIVKAGDYGTFWQATTGEAQHTNICEDPLDFKDSTGAGDANNGGVLSVLCRLQGRLGPDESLKISITRANKVSHAVIQVVGALAPIDVLRPVA